MLSVLLSGSRLVVGLHLDPGLAMIIGAFAFALGASIASFLNVVIWRVPRGESIVRPPSHCPKCNAPIRWWQNIPILSWLALRGRCANCREPISPRYVIVEFIGGTLFLSAFLKYASSDLLFLPFAWIWISLMIVGSFIDFDHKLLPDFVTVGGMVLGVLCGVLGAVLNASLADLIWSLGGLALGFSLLWLVRFFGSKAFGREAMGLGDVFLMGAVGALFGPVAVLVTLIISSVLGSIVGLAMVAFAKTRLGHFAEIPYGPYICLGCLVWMFYGPGLVSAYLNLFR